MMISRNEKIIIVSGGGQIPDISIPFDLSEIDIKYVKYKYKSAM